MAHGIVVPETIDYLDSDGLPMAESESQLWPILYVGAALDCYFQARDDVYVVGNLMLYYQEGDPGRSVSPGLMVVFGAAEAHSLVVPAVGGAKGAGFCSGDRLGEYAPDGPGREA